MKKILTFFLLLLSWQAFTQVTGVVVDETDMPMIGANILIQGTSTGTTTDMDGKFSIQAAPSDSLVFDYIGYKTEKRWVGNQSLFHVKMMPDVLVITDVVVMGYSSKTKTEISSAVAVLSNEELNDVMANDVGSLLQGKVSGVQVLESSGEPGSGAEIRIRGISTIKPGNAEPLFVVDGIIGGTFDPNDVESITVLKDAGATGMYGARANKGVIVVTTKKAKSEKVAFEFRSSYGYNTPDHGNIQMMSSQEFYEDFSAELYRDKETHEIDKIKFYLDYPQELKSRDWGLVDRVFKSAPLQKYYLAASGKSKKFGYYVSGTYYDEVGTFRNTGNKKINVRVNTDLQLTSRVNLRNNINISSSKGTSYDYLDMYYSYLGVPWDNPFNADGTPKYVDGHTQNWWSRDHINPLHSIDYSDYSYKGIDINYDLVLGVRLNSWLKFTTSNRMNFATDKNHRFVSKVAAGTFHDKGFVSESSNMYYGVTSTNLFRLEQKFGQHNLDGLIGGEFDRSYWEGLNLEGKGIPEGFSVPEVASSEFKIGGGHDKSIFRSFISQANYNFDHTYFLTASYRIDASSNFPANSRVAHFPSISASWIMNKMSFLEDNKTINSLKLRGSFGVTGDPEIGASRFLGLYALNTQYSNRPAATPYQLANPNLTWERTNQYNLGIDVGLYKDRIDLQFDLYNNVTKDLLILASQPLSQGFEYRWENSGQVTNRGFEIGLSTMNVKRKHLTWSTNFNIAKNNNELAGFDAPIFTTLSGISQVYRNGGEIYTFMLPKWLGVDTETGAPQWEKIERNSNGDIISRSVTNNYTEAAPQEVGSALPKFSGGLSSNLTYRGVTLFANMAYQYGNKIYNFTRVFMDNDGHEPYYNNMKPKSDWKRWERPGDVATHPSMQNNALSKEPSSRYLEDGSFIKIRTINLSYNLPNRWASRLKLQDITIGLSGNNLFTFTQFWGQDPEVTLVSQNWSMPGVSDFKYPNNKRYMFNLNLKF